MEWRFFSNMIIVAFVWYILKRFYCCGMNVSRKNMFMPPKFAWLSVCWQNPCHLLTRQYFSKTTSLLSDGNPPATVEFLSQRANQTTNNAELWCLFVVKLNKMLTSKSSQLNSSVEYQYTLATYFAVDVYTCENICSLIKAQPQIFVLWYPVNYDSWFMFALLNITVWLHRLSHDVWWALLLMRSTSIPHGTMAHTLGALCLWYQTQHIFFFTLGML